MRYTSTPSIFFSSERRLHKQPFSVYFCSVIILIATSTKWSDCCWKHLENINSQTLRQFFAICRFIVHWESANGEMYHSIMIYTFLLNNLEYIVLCGLIHMKVSLFKSKLKGNNYWHSLPVNMKHILQMKFIPHSVDNSLILLIIRLQTIWPFTS